jgi:hypothetical protein
MRVSLRRPGAAVFAALAVLALGVASCTNPDPGPGPGPSDPGPSPSGSNQRGPNPTQASISAIRGPFATATARVGRGNGFGGGTIHYPTDTSQGRFGAVVVVPGFISGQSSVSWYGARIASQGFVVMIIDTNTPLDFPEQRGAQANAALRYLSSNSTVANRVDASRQAVMGWSMGGGGTLDAAASNPNIRAIIPLAAWSLNTRRPGLRVPALVISCAADIVAPTASMSNPIYSSIGSTEKGAFSISGGHFCVTSSNTAIAKMSISWLKRFVDEDTRYSALVCQGPGLGATNWRSTCPV